MTNPTYSSIHSLGHFLGPNSKYNYADTEIDLKLPTGILISVDNSRSVGPLRSKKYMKYQ